MHVDPRVFLSRPKDLPMKVAVPLADALSDAAAGADKIVVFSAYYGTGYLEATFGSLPRKTRRTCSLTLVFGLESAARLAHAVGELRALRQSLVKLGFRSPVIRLFSKNAPFHTKLYYFKRSTQPIWFIGSANASPAIDGARHELMLRLSGRHDTLMEYLNSVIENSVAVEEAGSDTNVVSDIRSFLLNGVLCYRPLSRVSFTFETCQINSDHRAVLKRSVAAASMVPHADPQTEGFGFSLTNAVGQITGVNLGALHEADSEAGRSMSRLKFRHMAVETIYGYWLPATYGKNVRNKLRLIEAKSLGGVKKFASHLADARMDQLEAELERHVRGLKAFFAVHKVEIEPKSDYRRRFRDFVRARKLWLSNEAQIERMIRRLHVEQMPDIWSDEEAAQKFEASFFEDLAFRFDVPGKSWIVSVLKEELVLTGTPGPEKLRAALAKRLKEGLADTVWGDEEDGDFN